MKELYERWLPVVGYEGLYEVSNHARVRSLDRWVVYSNGVKRFYKGKLLKPALLKKGYATVALGKDHRNKYVHRLVAEAFLGPCPEGMEVLHGPNGVADNSVNNLSYGTRRQNMQDKLRDGTQPRGTQCYQTKLSEDDVREIRRMKAEFVPLSVISERFNISKPHICGICSRIRWAHI